MVAGTTVVAGVGAGAGPFLLAEQRRDRGVDVDEHLGHAALAQRGDPVLGHELFEVFEGLLVEAPQVVVEDVDARHAAAGQVHEQRVGREHLQVEYALAAGHRDVDDGRRRPSGKRRPRRS